jgi:hypothetical protein
MRCARARLRPRNTKPGAVNRPGFLTQFRLMRFSERFSLHESRVFCRRRNPSRNASQPNALAQWRGVASTVLTRGEIRTPSAREPDRSRHARERALRQTSSTAPCRFSGANRRPAWLACFASAGGAESWAAWEPPSVGERSDYAPWAFSPSVRHLTVIVPGGFFSSHAHGCSKACASHCGITAGSAPPHRARDHRTASPRSSSPPAGARSRRRASNPNGHGHRRATAHAVPARVR